MKLTRVGGTFVLTLPGAENAVVCGKCGFPFRGNHAFGGQSRKSCPRCGESGPFEKVTDAELAAHIESLRAKPSDYLRAAVGLVIVCAAVAFIVWAWLMPNNALERTGEHRGPRLTAAQRWWSAAQLGR